MACSRGFGQDRKSFRFFVEPIVVAKESRCHVPFGRVDGGARRQSPYRQSLNPNKVEATIALRCPPSDKEASHKKNFTCFFRASHRSRCISCVLLSIQLRAPCKILSPPIRWAARSTSVLTTRPATATHPPRKSHAPKCTARDWRPPNDVKSPPSPRQAPPTRPSPVPWRSALCGVGGSSRYE